MSFVLCLVCWEAGKIVFSTKRGLRKQHYIKNEVDIKTFNDQSDEGRDVRKHKFSSLVKTKEQEHQSKLIDGT